jgi:hypothetical protein
MLETIGHGGILSINVVDINQTPQTFQRKIPGLAGIRRSKHDHQISQIGARGRTFKQTAHGIKAGISVMRFQGGTRRIAMPDHLTGHASACGIGRPVPAIGSGGKADPFPLTVLPGHGGKKRKRNFL